MVKVNGVETSAAGKTILELVEAEGYQLTQVAVERNEEIVPKAQYGAVTVQDGDVIEIVRFVGGG